LNWSRIWSPIEIDADDEHDQRDAGYIEIQ